MSKKKTLIVGKTYSLNISLDNTAPRGTLERGHITISFDQSITVPGGGNDLHILPGKVGTKPSFSRKSNSSTGRKEFLIVVDEVLPQGTIDICSIQISPAWAGEAAITIEEVKLYDMTDNTIPCDLPANLELLVQYGRTEAKETSRCKLYLTLTEEE